MGPLNISYHVVDSVTCWEKGDLDAFWPESEWMDVDVLNCAFLPSLLDDPDRMND